jgi:hypothetical protein
MESGSISGSGHPLDLPQPRSKWPLWIALIVIGLTVVGSLGYQWYRAKQWEAEWSRLGPLEPRGGQYFPGRLELKVPLFRQADDRWRNDPLGKTKASLAAEGCAVASAAMVLASYGADTDPGRLNDELTENDGYVGEGWLVWEKAAEVTGNIARKAYEDDPSYRLIDEQLLKRNPVIVRLRTKGGTTHFVVIAGKEGFDYLTLDPGGGAGKGLYPLREFGSKIEKLRYYEKVK